LTLPRLTHILIFRDREGFFPFPNFPEQRCRTEDA
jgi:hypothetical protein